MNHGQNGWLVLLQSVGQLIECESLSPGLFDDTDISSITACHVSQTVPEITLDCNQDPITGFNRVRQGCFHGRTSGAAHGQSEAIVCLPGVAKQFLNLTHQIHIERIKVSDGSSRQS